MPSSVTEKTSSLTDSSMPSSFDPCDRSANQTLLEVLVRGRGGLMPGIPGFCPNTEKPTNRYITVLSLADVLGAVGMRLRNTFR
jgi:hypothetical protein